MLKYMIVKANMSVEGVNSEAFPIISYAVNY